MSKEQKIRLEIKAHQINELYSQGLITKSIAISMYKRAIWKELNRNNCNIKFDQNLFNKGE